MTLQERFEILKAKIERIVKTNDAPKVDFLRIIASHNGYIIQDSITFSFRRFKEKYGDEKFEEVLKDLKEDGVLVERYGLRFTVFDEKGEFDYKAGEELAKFTGKLIFESNQQIKQVIDKILEEPEGIELLKFIAKEKGVNIINGQEPWIREIIGKQSYERLVETLIKNNILVEYAWSSRKHRYAGYKLLPSVDEYIKTKLGIFELTKEERIVLAYIASMDEIFSYPATWYVRFDYLSEYEHRIPNICSLHKKLLASLIYRTEEDVQKIIDDLKSKNLLTEVDSGYTRSGLHRGTALQLSKFGQRMIPQIKEEIKARIESKIKEIFSNQDACVVYYLFCHEKIPLSILRLINQDAVSILLRDGFISDKQVFLAFKEGTPYQEYIASRINLEDAQKDLREKCASILSQDEKMFLGFLSECGNVILGKYPDGRSWNSVTARTRRKYSKAYESLIVNFPYLKKLFSYLTGLSFEKIDEITSNLEKKMFLVREKDPRCGFPGYIITYKLPVKFSFDIERETLKSKLHEYINFLVKDIEKCYNQLIFLDYLTQTYDAHKCQFLVDVHLVADLLKILNYEPPPKYSPVYAFEDKVIVLYPWLKDEIKKEIYELKLRLIEPIKNAILQLTENYRNNISEKTSKEGYFIVEVESPDPSIGVVSFVITPWISPFTTREISNNCTRSNTINLFTFYPNYPQIKSMLTTDGRNNLIVIRNNVAYLYLRKSDKITQTILTKLADYFEIRKEGEVVKKEIEELEEKFPNLRKVRFILPEVEDLLRNTIRPFLIREFGEKWQETIKQKFPKAEDKRQKWQKEHPSEETDILQGISIGDFVTLFEDKKFSFLKKCFKDFELAKASINKFLKRKEYHHGRPKDGKDIPNEEIEILNTAYRTLKEMIKPKEFSAS